MAENIIKIYADGSCLGNPGVGGYAAVLMYGENMKTISGGQEDTTNNQMELKAVIEGLKLLKTDKINIEMYVDSSYVHKGITEYIDNWVKNGWKTAGKQPVKNRELWQELHELDRQYKTERFWVKAHADNHLNNLVDKLARKEATKLQDSSS